MSSKSYLEKYIIQERTGENTGEDQKPTMRDQWRQAFHGALKPARLALYKHIIDANGLSEKYSAGYPSSAASTPFALATIFLIKEDGQDVAMSIDNLFSDADFAMLGMDFSIDQYPRGFKDTINKIWTGTFSKKYGNRISGVEQGEGLNFAGALDLHKNDEDPFAEAIYSVYNKAVDDHLIGLKRAIEDNIKKSDDENFGSAYAARADKQRKITPEQFRERWAPILNAINSTLNNQEARMKAGEAFSLAYAEAAKKIPFFKKLIASVLPDQVASAGSINTGQAGLPAGGDLSSYGEEEWDPKQVKIAGRKQKRYIQLNQAPELKEIQSITAEYFRAGSKTFRRGDDKPDGLWGAETYTAIRLYQRDLFKLWMQGKLDEGMSEQAEEDYGPAAREATDLSARYQEKVFVDGIWGPKTAALFDFFENLYAGKSLRAVLDGRQAQPKDTDADEAEDSASEQEEEQNESRIRDYITIIEYINQEMDKVLLEQSNPNDPLPGIQRPAPIQNRSVTTIIKQTKNPRRGTVNVTQEDIKKIQDRLAEAQRRARQRKAEARAKKIWQSGQNPMNDIPPESKKQAQDHIKKTRQKLESRARAAYPEGSMDDFRMRGDAEQKALDMDAERQRKLDKKGGRLYGDDFVEKGRKLDRPEWYEPEEKGSKKGKKKKKKPRPKTLRGWVWRFFSSGAKYGLKGVWGLAKMTMGLLLWPLKVAFKIAAVGLLIGALARLAHCKPGSAEADKALDDVIDLSVSMVPIVGDIYPFIKDAVEAHEYAKLEIEQNEENPIFGDMTPYEALDGNMGGGQKLPTKQEAEAMSQEGQPTNMGSGEPSGSSKMNNVYVFYKKGDRTSELNKKVFDKHNTKSGDIIEVEGEMVRLIIVQVPDNVDNIDKYRKDWIKRKNIKMDSIRDREVSFPVPSEEEGK